MDYARKIAPYHYVLLIKVYWYIILYIDTKLKYIDTSGDEKRVNSSNFNVITLKFAEKFDQPFSYVFIFGNMFIVSHGFVAMPDKSVSNIHVLIYPYLISEWRRNCSTLWPAQQRNRD